ncbi:DUF4153 domain-containing protein [Anaerotalea alkaliphila]|uniref:DUF4153 domain-containing protein n=1 Tax=Anaerotalea alkaliphila TaxID=2662126 RepID=A0A7X5KLG8_9FIRM|nr:DUF4153 domain-containing protein [Anaerotalea alkaliphila]NDL66826.1 DUF4153 domain-containing protein [Anaerotalea alkaliphila]
MNVITRSISQVFKGAAKAFQTFPASIASALAFAIVTMVRIQMDWPQQEAYNFLFNCLHLAFALGAIFSLAAVTAAQSRRNEPRAFLAANLLGAAVVVATFLLLILFGGTDTALDGTRYARVTGLAASRVSAAMFVSLLSFVILAGHPKDQSDFASSFFMTHKAFFIALLYGLVIVGGASGVAGAIQALLYRGMSSKVYMYIGTVAGFLAFTIFLGYFPDFRKGEVDERRETAQKQPRFIEVLFGYIMVPIALALTVVLLIWSGRTVVTGEWPPFLRLSGIAASYAVGGIWLHIMVTQHESGLAKFYRLAYPVSALVILVFEARALLVQLGRSGLKTEEYSFGLIWIIAVLAAVLLLLLKANAHTPIALLTCAVAVFSVLPLLGYHALPVAAQVNRLETLLVDQRMLEGGQLLPAAAEPELSVREAITDAVNFLAYMEDARLPAWFDKRLAEGNVFRDRLGFEQAWPERDEFYPSDPGGYMGTSLYLQAEAIDIGDYGWAVNLLQEKGGTSARVDGRRGDYRIHWTVDPPTGIPSLKVELDGRVILEEDLNDYIDRITGKYPPGRAEPFQATLEDMSLRLETPEVDILLVFGNVDIHVDTRQDTINYWINLNALYLREK